VVAVVALGSVETRGPQARTLLLVPATSLHAMPLEAAVPWPRGGLGGMALLAVQAHPAAEALSTRVQEVLAGTPLMHPRTGQYPVARGGHLEVPHMCPTTALLAVVAAVDTLVGGAVHVA